MKTNTKNSALLIVDMQYDFMKDGSLEVQNANELIPTINQLAALDWDLVIASKDWHPHNHISFVNNHPNSKLFESITLADGSPQIMWPSHCVQNSKGAEIHQDIDTDNIQYFVHKGQNPMVDSYSAFFDNNKAEKTEMDALLKQHKIEAIYVAGLARDFCVKFTALDGKALGYETYFVWDATRAVDSSNNKILENELKSNNIHIVNSKELF